MAQQMAPEFADLHNEFGTRFNHLLRCGSAWVAIRMQLGAGQSATLTAAAIIAPTVRTLCRADELHDLPAAVAAHAGIDVEEVLRHTPQLATFSRSQ